MSPSPLGRYDDVADDEPLHEVRLLRVPLKIMIAGREHHDGLMREFALLALSEDRHRAQLPSELLELVEILGVKYGRAAERPAEEIDAALAAGQETVDLTYQVPAHAVQAAETLDALMTQADEFCQSEQLLSVRRHPLIAEFGAWYLDQFRRQLSGQPPVPWPGPLDLD